LVAIEMTRVHRRKSEQINCAHPHFRQPQASSTLRCAIHMNMHAQNPPLLDFHNLRVMRAQKIALDGFSLCVGADEHVAILGPNGCGKSTLIKTITRECYPMASPESSMSILGKDTWNVFALRARLGIVSNDWMLSCTGNALGRDVVLSGFFSSISIFSNHAVTAQQRELADKALADLNISHLADRPVCEMSSGEARRVLIARALVHKPRALLFDEPCNSLDLAAQQGLRHTMSTLARTGTAIILVTHELADIVPEIQRVVLMSSGRVVADGSKEEILQVDRLAKLFGVSVEIARRDGHYHLW
jgi:iron complex transport system ATP-binding protein